MTNLSFFMQIPELLLILLNFQSVSFGMIMAFFFVLVLLVCSALISGSEIAFFSLDPPHVEELKNEKASVNDLILNLLDRPKRLLATILISNNFVNVALVILSTFIVNSFFDFSNFPILAFVIQVLIITALILLFGEIMPKIYATQNSIRFARFMARPLAFLIKLFSPLSYLLVNSTNIIDKRLSGKSQEISISELSEAIEIASNEESGKEIEEKKILQGIVKFGDIDVNEIMTTRLDVTAVDVSINYSELLKTILECGYSRIPVYEESFDKLLGIVYIKDLLSHLNKEKDFEWKSIIRPAYFVPENKKIIDLLQEFQLKKIHMAIVVDEYGGTSGLITLEDILEEIVGEISDEFDAEEAEFSYSKIDDENYVFEAKTSLNDFYKIVEIADDYFDEIKGESESLAGLILELKGRLPFKNEEINYNKITFKVLSVDKRRIKRLKVTINE
jgi:putative hemolysin